MKKELLKKFQQFELSSSESKKIRGGDPTTCQTCGGNFEPCFTVCIVVYCSGPNEPPVALQCDS